MKCVEHTLLFIFLSLEGQLALSQNNSFLLTNLTISSSWFSNKKSPNMPGKQKMPLQRHKPAFSSALWNGMTRLIMTGFFNVVLLRITLCGICVFHSLASLQLLQPLLSREGGRWEAHTKERHSGEAPQRLPEAPRLEDLSVFHSVVYVPFSLVLDNSFLRGHYRTFM